MSPRELDLVVLGATGFTGRQAAAYVAAHAPPGLRWALAGRSGERLAAVREGLGPAHADRELVVLDTLDQAAADDLAARTRVLLTTVGPFATLGGPVLGACARHGTHYVDITGETPWVRAMIDRWHEVAREQGARIVPCCGFDSVPSDLGTFMMARALRARWDQPTREVRAVFRARGGFNGGTLASALGMAERGDDRAMGDLFLLDPVQGRPGPEVVARSRDPRAVRYEPELGAWTAPFFMAPVNTRVVRRSAALLAQAGQGYGPDFVYQEAMWGGRGAGGRASATGVLAGVGLFSWALARPWGRRLVARLAPEPGEGPDEAAMDGGFFRTDLLAWAEDGRLLRGRVQGQGDPGNRCTVRMLCEAALCLCLEQAALPPAAGLLTPAVALGAPYLERLRRAGMRWEVMEPA